LPLELHFERINHPHIVGYKVRIVARGYGAHEGHTVTISDDYVSLAELEGEINRLMNQLYSLREEAKERFTSLPVVQDIDEGLKAFRDPRYGKKPPETLKGGKP
jgi:hypothetical protein